MNAPIAANLIALQFGGSAIAPTLLMYGLLIAIFYFILIRPQQKQRKAHEALIRTIKRGDEIVTAGGVVGEVVHVATLPKDPNAKEGADTSMSDRITIKSGDSRLIVERARIARVINAPTGSNSSS